MTARRRTAALGLVAGVAALVVLGPAPASLARFTDVSTPTGAVAADTLDPPAGLAAAGGASVTLTWTPTIDAYASGYDVLRGPATGGPYGVVGSVTPASVATTGDSPGPGTWFYVLRSVHGAWSSTASNEASAVVTPTTIETAYATCTTTAADTSGAGDDDGYQSNPSRACADDSLDATDGGSGTGGNESCGSGAIPDPRKDRHRFWGFETGLPGTVTTIDGISVRADLGMNNNGGTTNVCAQLSWDGGATWTAIQATEITGLAEATYTFGGTADTWGRSWALGDFSTANFRLRLIDASSQTTKRFDLDYVAVSVAYTP